MEELLLLSNPRRRRKHKARGRKRARRMSALQRKYFGPRVSANPKRRRKSRRSASPVATTRRTRRSKRRSGGGRSLHLSTRSATSVLKPALVGAVGAVGTNFVLSQLASRGVIPASLMTGKTRFLTQGVLAIGLGMLAAKSRFVGSGTATKMAEGALTVTLANAITEVANDNGVNLSGMGFYLPGFNPGRAVPNAGGSPASMAGMGKYVSGPGAGMSGMGRGVVPMRRNVGNINTFKF